MRSYDDGFLDVESLHDKHWLEMPEFVQKDVKPLISVIVKFRSEEDVKKFAKATGLTVTPYMKEVWYPQNKQTKDGLKVYADSDTVKKKRGRRTR